ncbi:ribosome assembly [Blastocladiella emersonii ATCC 22665]|nr:ribosome assembly [Blastocladiella emersonii ATCC 22665]
MSSKASAPAATTTQQIVAQFKSKDGDVTFPPMSLPVGTTANELELVLNQLMENEGKKEDAELVKYYFYVDNTDVVESLAKDVVQKLGKSTEQTIVIVYEPQSLFRVRAVTRCGATMSGHTGEVLSVHFSPDGLSLASGSGDNTVRIWDLSTSTPRATLKSHAKWVLCVAWSPDGKVIASGGMDGTVCLWDARAKCKSDGTVAPLAVLKGHRDAITSLAWEPLHRNAGCVRLASSSRDATVRVWDTKIKRTLYTVAQHTKSITCVKWGGEGLLYTASRDCTIKVWDDTDGKLVRTLAGHGHWVNTMALSSETLLRTGAHDHTGPRKFATPDEAAAAARERYETGHKGAERLVSGSDDFTLYLWKPAESKQAVTRMTGHQALVNQVTFSPSGHRIASASFDKSVKVWDGHSGAFLFNLRGHVGAVYQVVFSADERLLLSSSKDSTCKVWDLRTKKLKSDLPGHADEVYAVDWSPSGDRACSGSKDRTLKVWCQ